MREVIDQMGLPVQFSFPPKRIVSLVPSQTELLADLGLEHSVVGITKFCVHPAEWLNTKQCVGGTKNIHIDEIVALRPDLVIGNKEENSKEQIEQLAAFMPVWMSDITSLQQATAMITMIGEITGTSSIAVTMIADIHQQFTHLNQIKGSVLYLIWKRPWMVAGNETFVNSMLESIGLINSATAYRYPEMTDEMIAGCNADYIFVSSEPYPFKEKDLVELRALSPRSEVILVDGEMFSWYGSRLRMAPAYFNQFGR